MSIQESPARKSPIQILTPLDWNNAIKVDRHYLMEGLARRGWPVVYSTGNRCLWDRHTGDWKSAPVFGRFDEVAVDQSHDITVDNAGKLMADWPKFDAWSEFTLKHHAKRLVKASTRNGGTPINYICKAHYFDYLKYLQDGPIVLHVNDAWWLNPGWKDQDKLEKLVERANLIITVGDAMAEGLPGNGPARAKVLLHGVLAENYIEGLARPCPADLESIPRPRIGYIGRVSKKVDLKLIFDIATRVPDWHWVIVGHVGIGFGDDADAWQLLQQCQSSPNIHFLGPKPSSQMPEYMAHMDVNTLCYKTLGGFWEAISPLKLFEYLAVGKPIIGTPIDSLRRFDGLIQIASSADGWIAEIREALANDSQQQVRERQQVALENSWSSRVIELEQWLGDL